MTHHGDPGDTFLGISTSVDPFQLLGLPRRPLDDAEVLQALGARMSAIASHPRGQTHEANEVRLAVHAAAAQLLDPNLQQVLLSQGAPPVPPPTSEILSRVEHDVPVATAPSEASVPSALSHDVLLVAAACGGWNSRAMRRLAMLAHARGIASSELPSVITEVLAGSARHIPVRHELAPGAEPAAERVGSIRPSAHARGARRRSVGSRLIPWLIGSATLVMLILVWMRLTAVPSQGVALQDVIPDETLSISEGQLQGPVIPPIPAANQSAPGDVRASARRMTALAQRNTPLSDSDLEAFRAMYNSVASNWDDLDSDQRGAIHNAIVELLYRNVSSQNVALSLIRVINEPFSGTPVSPEAFRRWVWSAGTLSRLSMERNLPTSIDSAVISGLTNAFRSEVPVGNQSFQESVVHALRVSGDDYAGKAPFETFWAVWLQQLGAVVPAHSVAHNTAVLDVLESILVEGPDPSQSRETFQALETLTGALKLEPSGPVAVRIVSWFSDDRITASDLSSVMRPLITRSRIEKLDSSMIPSPGMNQSERMALRAELESVLLGIDSGTNEAVAAWVSIADQQLDRSPGIRPVEIVGRSLVLSRLSAAAHATLWGDRQTADSILANLTDDIDRLIKDISDDQSGFLGGNNADEWAIKYIDARQNIPIRQALLSDLTRGKRILGPVAAEMIVRDAFLGTPATVRAQAREIVVLYADSPAILNAVLEYLPRIPKIRSSSELIESVAYTRLPAVDNPRWSIRARQACVDELLRRVSGFGEGQAIDLLVASLEESYKDRLPGTSSSSRSAADASELARVAMRLADFWRQSASQEIEDIALLAQLDELDRRHAGRKLLARGSLDQFAVEQVMAVESMALLVSAEMPQYQNDVQAITDALRAQRRASRTVLEQIVACEEASVRLWKLRLLRGAP